MSSRYPAAAAPRAQAAASHRPAPRLRSQTTRIRRVPSQVVQECCHVLAVCDLSRRRATPRPAPVRLAWSGVRKVRPGGRPEGPSLWVEPASRWVEGTNRLAGKRRSPEAFPGRPARAEWSRSAVPLHHRQRRRRIIATRGHDVAC
eukprot:scaffold72665_cov60-Phaeocystis_antarctica.AAC.1